MQALIHALSFQCMMTTSQAVICAGTSPRVLARKDEHCSPCAVAPAVSTGPRRRSSFPRNGEQLDKRGTRQRYERQVCQHSRFEVTPYKPSHPGRKASRGPVDSATKLRPSKGTRKGDDEGDGGHCGQWSWLLTLSSHHSTTRQGVLCAGTLFEIRLADAVFAAQQSYSAGIRHWHVPASAYALTFRYRTQAAARSRPPALLSSHESRRHKVDSSQ